MWSGVVEVMSTAPPAEDDSALAVFSGAMRRANASAVAMSHWSASARTGSPRSRSALTGRLPSSSGASANSRRRRVESSSSSQRLGRSSSVTPCRPSGGTMWLPGGRWPPSMTSRMCGVGGALVGAEAGPVAQVGREQAAEVVERGGDQAHRADRVGLAGALRVRQPLHPVPVGEVLLGAEHRDDELVGVLERRRGADHRARRRARPPRRRRTARCGRRHAGRSTPAGWAAGGARRAAGAGRTRRPGRPGRPARSPAAPAPATAAASTGRSARAGSCRRSRCAPTAGCGPRPARAARRARGGAS